MEGPVDMIESIPLGGLSHALKSSNNCVKLQGI